ncbi:uncharacterized protein LAESUDRAFT_747208 [Laetiporus sulphureus 93-53]|uniref:DUF6533 domain-containing protein n=1 Tax=Laetiporus sulphureus 93-53 TaxID=1314785 RepID=A0A165HC22_9APHY|nr:uncharacterized protein LAESUDRAFT_747208 [Laetiporus sulphureus 93-53]KZT11532.1 hypothetical protein LAESUDRAFT_747208 [Laetiporus sulphureus 93-53]
MPSGDTALVLTASSVESCLYLSAGALVLYDYLLTAGDEYYYIWKSELSFASVLFFAFRYCAVIDTAVLILSLVTLSSWPARLSCAGIVMSQMVFDIVLLASAAAFAALRIYAIYDRNKAVFGLVLCLGLLNPALTLYPFISMSPQTKMLPNLQVTCSFTTSISESVYDKWMIGGRASSVLADVIVFILTWVKTQPFICNSIQSRLQRLMLTDTAWYFGILSIINAVSMEVGHFDMAFPLATSHRQSVEGLAQLHASRMISIALSRLMLNLRNNYAKRKGETSFTDPTSLLFIASTIDADEEHLADDTGAPSIDGNADPRMENAPA